MKQMFAVTLCCAVFAATVALSQPATPPGPQVIPSDQQKLVLDKSGFYSQNILSRRANALAMITKREKTGEAERHAAWNDDILIQAGEATMILGGKIENPREVSKGETRGSGISGGKSMVVHAGDYVFVPVNTAHRMILSPGKTVRYAVIKTLP
jgi:mannose-6-phosphate isomerase-like protein (cupin superfamily)